MYPENNEQDNNIINNTPNEDVITPAPDEAEASRQAEEARQSEEARQAQISEAARRSEEKRRAEIAAEAARRAEAERRAAAGYNAMPTGATYYSAPQNTYQSGSYYSAYQPPQAPVVSKKVKARPSLAFTAVLCIFCILLSACSGFGGAMFYKYFIDDDPADFRGNGEVTINQSKVDPPSEIQEGSLTSIIDTVSQTVVEIRTEKVSYGMFFGNYVSEGAGSGVIISADGYIITNNHVVEGADTLTVRTKSGDEYEATLIGTDPQTDIAVIKIEATELPTATIGTSADLKVGQRAIAIGNPLGELGGTVTIGYISALDRAVNIEGVEMTLLQTDAAINPGNSGGGLFDEGGRLIGVVNAKSSGEDIEGLGFAIPIDTAISVATDLIEVGHVSGRPALGINVNEVNTSNYAQYRGTELQKYIDNYGVYVTNDERGNFKFGDRIVAIDDTTISSSADLASALNAHAIGDKVSVTVSRERKLVKIEVELVERGE